MQLDEKGERQEKSICAYMVGMLAAVAMPCEHFSFQRNLEENGSAIPSVRSGSALHEGLGMAKRH